MKKKILFIIPTYNEETFLERAINSVLKGTDAFTVTILVVNAGDCLKNNYPENIIIEKVREDYFWGDCMNYAFEWIKRQQLIVDFLCFLNADTYLLPGSVNFLLNAADQYPDSVISSPGYYQDNNNLELIYSNYKLHYSFLLVHEREKLWLNYKNAPVDPLEIPFIAGGQGVLIPFYFIDLFEFDSKLFPHFCADLDFWLQVYRKGIKFYVAPRAGAVNMRFLGIKNNSKDTKLKWSHIISPKSPYFWKHHWLIRKKHLNIVLAIISTVIVLPVFYSLKYFLGLDYRILEKNKKRI